MKHARLPAFLLSVIVLCTVCLTFSAVSVSEPYYTALAVPALENGILTTEDGQEWYRVRRFEDYADYVMTVKNEAGEQLILAVTDDAHAEYVWSYYRNSMTTSTAPRVSTLSTARYSLVRSGKSLMPYYTGSESGDMLWEHNDSALCWRGSSERLYLKYDPDSREPFTMTADRSEAAEVILYSRRTTLERCITKHPAAASYVIEGSGYPAPEFSVGLADVTADSISWYVDGVRQDCMAKTFRADTLTNQPVGVHRVSCLVTAHDRDGVYYREQSADAAFIIAKGVVPDSVMTFSDVHEEYELITSAIETVMQKTDGLLPALVICTGDLVNGPTAEKETELSRYYPQMIPHLGGLDAVFVAGNHDSAEAASVMSAAAGLGAREDLPLEGGRIFSGESKGARSGTSAKFAEGIVVYGINFDAALRRNGDVLYYTYEDVIRDVDRFLKETAAQYHGELVVISAHSGLHVVGLQEETGVSTQNPLYGWYGENAYNIDLSDELAQTINRYAEQYNMDIVFLLGHDHSRGEREMFMTEGDTLISPRHYADRSTVTQTLHFTYAHAGYLSSVIGCASKRFSFIYRDGDKFSYELFSAQGGLLRHEEFRMRHPYEAPAETTAAPASAGTTAAAAQTTASAAKAAAPDTGDETQAVLLAVPALFALLLSRKRRGNAA